MMMHFLPPRFLFFLGLSFLGTAVYPLAAATVWNGPPVTFTKASFADPTQAANQDRLTANVWLTRDATKGLFNAKTEAFFSENFSPDDTEWSYGFLTNYASLTYTSWQQWFGGAAGGGPPSTVNKDAVVHLKTDDIYLAIKFTVWHDAHVNPGGGFSYTRSSPAASSTPVATVLANPTLGAGGSFSFTFTNTPGLTFTAVAAGDLVTPSSNWTAVGTATETSPGQYQFTDAGTATNNTRRFYRIRSP